MIGRSSDLSRDLCCWPGRKPSAALQLWESGAKNPGRKSGVRDLWSEYTGYNPRVNATISRSQSPHSSDEAGQHKPVEPRGAGKWM